MDLTRKIDEVVKEIETKPLVFLLILSGISILWKSYPHFMIAELLPSDEYNNWVLLEVMIREGKAFDFFLSPPLQYYLMFLLNRITGIDSITMFRWTNSIIGGLSVFTFYYFCTGFIDDKDSVYATILYAFSEPFFYRSCFLGSTEILGLTLMFLTLGLYLRHQYWYTIPILVVSAYTHLAPFFFSVLVMITPFLLNRKTVLKAIAGGILMLALIFGPFSPHRKQKLQIFENAWETFSLDNLFVYSLRELVIVGGFSYLGTVFLSLAAIWHRKEWNLGEWIMFGWALTLMGASWLGYNSMIFSPRRMIVYMVIPMITVGSRVLTKGAMVGAIALMLISPPLVGTQAFVWVNDAITQPELDAIHWLCDKGYFNNSDWYAWFSDRTITQAINPYIFFFRPERDPASAFVSTSKELEEVNEFVSSIHKEYSNFLTEPEETTDSFSWNYVIISDRMKKQSFYLIRDTINGTRSVELRIPTLDRWIDNPNFTEIYNTNGVIVYEKKND